MNVVILSGRLTKDPEIRQTQTGKKVAGHGIAVDRQKKGEADFFDCVAWGYDAEFAEKYLHKGTKVIVEGRLQNDSYTDKQGQNRTATKIVVSHYEFCESKKAAEQSEREFTNVGGSNPAAEFLPIPEGSDADLPFDF